MGFKPNGGKSGKPSEGTGKLKVIKKSFGEGAKGSIVKSSLGKNTSVGPGMAGKKEY
jgi:hypothetical protein